MGKTKLTRMELVEMSLALEPHLPGSSESKGKQNPYDLPEGAPLIDPIYLISLHWLKTLGVGVSGGMSLMKLVVGYIEAQARLLSAAAEAESELVRRDKLNSGKSTLDFLYKECLKKGIDPANPKGW